MEIIMLTMTDHVTLWLEQDRPVRLYWREQRWRVTDTPTPIYAEADDVPPMITHPGKVHIGWRLRAERAGGEFAMLDLTRAGLEWRVTYSKGSPGSECR